MTDVRATGESRLSQAQHLAWAILSGLFCLWLTACAARLPLDFSQPQGRAVVADVPFHAQEDHQCGPAVLAMVLNHHGDMVTPEDIAQAIFRKDLRGTVSLDLALYPRGRGFATRFFRGTVADIVTAVDTGNPPVVMVDEGLGGIRVFHYMVVVGYEPEGVLVNSGRRRGQSIPWREFLSGWSGADRWTLLVEPKETR